MIEYCAGCHCQHEARAWKFKGKHWYCEKWYKVSSPEFYNQKQGDKIREDRVKNAKSIVQPWRDGKPSKEFIKLYPDKAKKTFTPEEIRTAKDTWRDVKGLKDIQGVK